MVVYLHYFTLQTVMFKFEIEYMTDLLEIFNEVLQPHESIFIVRIISMRWDR
jgi:hypothetical protein